MMTFLVYIENQNFTRIHIEEMILQVLILFIQLATLKYNYIEYQIPDAYKYQPQDRWQPLVAFGEAHEPLNSSAISNGKLVDTWAKLRVYDLIDVILLEEAFRNVQFRDIGSIGYR
jgi:hypothetical protein